jgi:hypothetical protein
MVQIFHPAWNTLSKVSIFGAVFFLGGVVWLSAAIHRSPYVTQEGVVRAQPVPFSHKHHVQGLGIDCRYCHTSVEEGAFAGMPSTKTCMSCHSVVWAQSELLAPVRASYQDDRSIEWTRVHDLPDFVYFDHSVHVAKGIGCASCHGEVDDMPLMWQESSLQMEWCLSCHRDPAPFIRPRERVFDMDFEMPLPHAEALRLAEEYGVESLTNCSICHR